MSDPASTNPAKERWVPVKAWKPGQSGNPKGRAPAPVDIAALARVHGPKCVNVVVDLLHSPDERIRLAAAQALLDRGYGKPLQTLATPDGNSPISLHLLATQFVGKQLLAERAEQPLPPTIQHEGDTNGQAAFDLNAPPPNE